MHSQKGGHLTRLLGSIDINALTRDDTQSYIEARLDEGAAKETVRKELCTLRRSLEIAHERRLLTREPEGLIPRFRTRYQPRDRYLTIEQVPALLRALPPHRQMWVLLAVFTGGRESEVANLRWEDIDWRMQTIRIRGTKTAGSFRAIPLHQDLASTLRKEARTEGLIVGDWQNVRRDLPAACIRAKVPTITPNDLRRTFASWLKQQGVDSAIVARFLGHRSTRMVDLVYGQFDHGTLAQAMTKLPSFSRSPDCDTGVTASGGRHGTDGTKRNAAARDRCRDFRRGNRCRAKWLRARRYGRTHRNHDGFRR